MGWLPVICHWDPANLASIAKHGVERAPEHAEAIIRLLALYPHIRILLDTAGSARVCERCGKPKERDGGKRYVVTAKDTSSGKYVVIYFTVRDERDVPGIRRVVRPISIRFAHDRDPLLRETPPKRFVRAPSLVEILYP